MLATIADNGVYHQAHIIKYWQLPDAGAYRLPVDPTHQVLNAQQASQVQYAMEATTVDGTAVNAAYGPGHRPIIGKTGTTSEQALRLLHRRHPPVRAGRRHVHHAQSPANTKENLSLLGGGGFGGFWPAKIWNTFAQAEFANLPAENFQNPVIHRPAVEPDRQAAQGEAKKTTPMHLTVHGKNDLRSGQELPDPTTPTPQPTQLRSRAGGGVPTQTASPRRRSRQQERRPRRASDSSVADHEQ